MRNWTAAPVAAEGPSKRRTLLTFYAARPKAQPAQLVRGSSRRIMTMRFRPANIRVINRRVCSWAVIGPAVQNQRSKLTSGNVFPLRRPSQAGWMPERCSPSRVRFAAPKSGAPLTAPRRSGRRVIATGGSGGNTSQTPAKTKGRTSLLRRKAGMKTKLPQITGGLTGRSISES